MELIKVSFLLIILTAFAVRSLSVREFTLDLRVPSKDGYSTFLSEIRKALKDSNFKYGGTDIPVIGSPTKTYHRINLVTNVGNVSLGPRHDDVYIVAYLSKNDQQKTRAYFFGEGINPQQLEEIFPETKGGANQQEIKEYRFSYGSLTAAGNTTVKKAGLGISKLISYTGAVAGKKRIVKDEAKLILVAVQMVSEVVRYRYIEDTVLSHFPNGFTSKDKLIIPEKNWGTISQNIKDSKNGVFTPPKEYKTPDFTTSSWTVSTVAELKVGLLKYCGP